MIIEMNLWQVFGFLVLVFGILDAYKYRLLTEKVKRYESSRGQSRLATNYAVIYKILLVIWSIFYLKDWVVSLSALLALYTSTELFWNIYVYYPYKHRGLLNFKRPNLIRYIINSFMPNTKQNRI